MIETESEVADQRDKCKGRDKKDIAIRIEVQVTVLPSSFNHT